MTVQAHKHHLRRNLHHGGILKGFWTDLHFTNNDCITCFGALFRLANAFFSSDKNWIKNNQVGYDIYSEEDLLALDSSPESVAVAVAPPPGFLEQVLAADCGCCCRPCFCPFLLHLTCLVFSWRRSRAPASVMPSVAVSVSVAVRRSRRAKSRQVITIEAKKLGKLTQWGITNHPTYILCYCNWFGGEGSIQCVLIQDARDSPICRRCKILKLSILTFCTSQYILRWL